MRDILIAGAGRLGVALDEAALDRLERYAQILEEENKKMNLTAVTGEEEIAQRHFIDSLGVLRAAGDGIKNARIIDVGSGPGFPGVPMKIAEPTIRLTALDSTEKRVAFLQRLYAALGIEAEAVAARAEELACDKRYREGFDFAVSRAVARLNVLAELCLPYVKVGGAFLAMKTAASGEETDEAKHALKELGGELDGYFDYEIMGVMHRVVRIKKVAHTPARYPRRFAKIQKQPL